MFPEVCQVIRGHVLFPCTVAEEEGDAWSFKPVEVVPETREGGWVQVRLLQDVAKETRFAYNNAYYLNGRNEKR